MNDTLTRPTPAQVACDGCGLPMGEREATLARRAFLGPAWCHDCRERKRLGGPAGPERDWPEIDL